MNKPNGYDAAEAREGGFRQPAAGPVILGVTRVYVQKNKNQEDQLVLFLDIAAGPFKNFFRQQSERFNADRYLRFYQNVEGESLSHFKGVITAFEESNVGFKFDWNEETLVHKKIGGNLREEEFMRRDNSIGTNLRVAYLCSIRSVEAGEHKVQPVKKLVQKQDLSGFDAPPPDDFNQVPPQENLPF